MQDNVSLATSEKDLDVKYGVYDLGPEREAARGSLKYILADMNDIRKSFIRLGFHLNEMLLNRYYEDFGYPTMEEFAEANLGMDKSNVYRYIRVFENFAADNGYRQRTLYLDDKWKDYSFSQLVEMCSMSDTQRRACNPGMTIRQIREVKKTVAKDVDWSFLNRIVSGQTGQDDGKVAMSPQKDRSKDFSYDYCSGLHGAARNAYVKSRKAVSSAEIYLYDAGGHRLKIEPLAANLSMDLLYCKDGKYVFRLSESSPGSLGMEVDLPDSVSELEPEQEGGGENE